MDQAATQSLSIESLWKTVGFTPNAGQRKAILHIDGPLYLTAGPGSGKTRVLLWRTLNLIVFHDVEPEEIYLSTFTEKAALQLREGLQALLGMVTNITDKPYDLAQMYVGTVHSLCRRLLGDRRLSADRERIRAPHLLDELGQYFHLYRRRGWDELTASAGLDNGANETINAVFGRKSRSRHWAVVNCMATFNRLSEECIDADAALVRLSHGDSALTSYLKDRGIDADALEKMLRLYRQYGHSLLSPRGVSSTDFSLLQQEALRALDQYDSAGSVFRHIIVDEYQDTNTIQERLFFRLAAGHKNICVVGDDDQALYRFRGATVENFVQFPARCQAQLGVTPTRIPLSVNYRSRKRIVDFYTGFIDCCDWSAGPESTDWYRVVDKRIRAHRADAGTAVVATTPGKPLDIYPEIAHLVRELIDQGKVKDPNEIAFLFPSLKSAQVPRMRAALEEEGLLVYAPRAGRFLEVDEAVEVFGVLGQILGTSKRGHALGGDYKAYCTWLDAARERGAELMAEDGQLAQYVKDRQAEIQTIRQDYKALCGVAERNRWKMVAPYNITRMKRALHSAPGLSQQAKRALASVHFERIAQSREQAGRPFTLKYIVNRATSLDWNVLDLFYRICGFTHFRAMFDLAESGKDEGPICNLGLISQYLARFMDEYITIITAQSFDDQMFQRIFFMSYLYALFRLGESEYEDAEDPFPKGRIPFLTIHQSKGLEFPVVVLANPRKGDRGPQRVEELVRPFLDRDQGEPLERMNEFDIMRMFYVALSRAKNLLVIAHLKGQGQWINQPFKDMLDDDFPRTADLDVSALPAIGGKEDKLPKAYSYTADFLNYKKCPRQYMIFRKYGFVPSRSQTMFFGSLVHQTLEDLHNRLIARRAQ